MSMAAILLRKREQIKQREAEGLDLLAHRKALGMTQAQMGAALGYHWNMIARMERGEVPIQKRTWLSVRLLRAKGPETAAAIIRRVLPRAT